MAPKVQIGLQKSGNPEKSKHFLVFDRFHKIQQKSHFALPKHETGAYQKPAMLFLVGWRRHEDHPKVENTGKTRAHVSLS